MASTEKERLLKVSHIQFTYQPIVNIHTGQCYGYEALMKNPGASGFSSPRDLFDFAHRNGKLEKIDRFVKAKSVDNFSKLARQQRTRLFLNMDSRLLARPAQQLEFTRKILKQYAISPETICYEVSGVRDPICIDGLQSALKLFKEAGLKVAFDNFGEGFTGLKFLYGFEPDFIKIDPFFVRDIDSDDRKRMFVSGIVDIARHLGSSVVAVGVQARGEYHALKELGADLIQGDLVQSREKDLHHLKGQFQKIHFLSQQGQPRNKAEDRDLVLSQMQRPEPIPDSMGIFEIFEKFKANKNATFFPVVNADGEPLGIIRERSFKEYTYSLYGTQLLQNPAFGKNIRRFIDKFPVVDIHASVEKILQVYSENKDMEGILIAENMKYEGLLSAPSLLKVLNDKMMNSSRDLDSLTRLPASTPVFEYLSEALRKTGAGYHFVFLGLDRFRSYNDAYGYRQGDKVLVHFSDKLKQLAAAPDRFAGHLGADRFFLGSSNETSKGLSGDLEPFLAEFAKEMEGFYDPTTVKKGYVLALDMDGKMKKYPMVDASAVVFELPSARRRIYSVAEIRNLVERVRRQAGQSEPKILYTGPGDLEKLPRLFKTVPGGKQGTAKATTGQIFLRRRA